MGGIKEGVASTIMARKDGGDVVAHAALFPAPSAKKAHFYG